MLLTMSTLHGEPVYPGDKVFDTEDGYGCVESVTAKCIWVNVGKRTKRRYSKDGFTGKRCRPTLFWHRPPSIIFAKDSQVAAQQRVFIESSIALLNNIGGDCGAVVIANECEENNNEPCNCPSC